MNHPENQVLRTVSLIALMLGTLTTGCTSDVEPFEEAVAWGAGGGGGEGGEAGEDERAVPEQGDDAQRAIPALPEELDDPPETEDEAVPCEGDDDCEDYCGLGANFEGVCKAWAIEGDPCGGYMPIEQATRCAPGLGCASVFDFPVEAGGLCAPICESQSDCDAGTICTDRPEGSFCISDG